MVKVGSRFRINNKELIVFGKLNETDTFLLCAEPSKDYNGVDFFDELCKVRFKNEIKKLDIKEVGKFRRIQECIVKECIRNGKFEKIQ